MDKQAEQIQRTLKSVSDLQERHSEMAAGCLKAAFLFASIYLIFYVIANAKSDGRNVIRDLAGELLNITLLAFLAFIVFTESLLILQGRYDFIMPAEQKIALLFGCVYLFFDAFTKILLYFEKPIGKMKAKKHIKPSKTEPS